MVPRVSRRSQMRRLSVSLLSLFISAAGLVAAGTAFGEGKQELHPNSIECLTGPAAERVTCEKTRIEMPESEPPAPAPRTGVPQPIYPGGKLPPPALPAPRGK